MTWFRPDRQRFALHVMRQLRRAGVSQAMRFEADAFQIVIGQPPRSWAHNLDNHYAEVCAVWPWQRRAVTEQFVRSLVESHLDEPQPADFELVLPVVRGSALEIETREMQPPLRSIAGYYAVALVEDSPSSMRYVNKRDLETARLDFDLAMRQAIHRLTLMPLRAGRLPGDVLYVNTGDCFDASRLLLAPKIAAEAGLPERVVAVAANRDCLLIANADDATSLARLAAYAQDAAKQPRSMEPVPVLVDGQDPFQWRLYDAPKDSAFDDIRSMSREARAVACERQYEALKQLHAKAGNDETFIAHVLQRAPVDDSDRAPRLLAAWTKGVKTLLPEVEVVALIDLDRPGDDKLVGTYAWADLVRAVPELLSPMGLIPERWLTRGFPSTEALALLTVVRIPKKPT